LTNFLNNPSYENKNPQLFNLRDVHRLLVTRWNIWLCYDYGRTSRMKFQLGPYDRIDQHHMYDLIRAYMQSVNGYVEPEYIIIHPNTFYKIMQAVGEAGDEFRMRVMTWSMDKGEKMKMYGVSVIQSFDVEEDFVIIT
jgi:hypothetical protein